MGAKMALLSQVSCVQMVPIVLGLSSDFYKGSKHKNSLSLFIDEELFNAKRQKEQLPWAT